MRLYLEIGLLTFKLVINKKLMKNLLMLIFIFLSIICYGQKHISYKDQVTHRIKGKVYVDNNDLDKYVGTYTARYKGKILSFKFDKVTAERISGKTTFVNQYLSATRHILVEGKAIPFDDTEFKLQYGGNLPENVNKVKFFIPKRSSLIVYDLIYLDAKRVNLRQGHSEGGLDVITPEERERAYLPVNIILTKED
jgi:hypothetical protein